MFYNLKSLSTFFHLLNFNVTNTYISSKLNDLDKIRESCELFSAQFPLAPEFWTRWIHTELSIATNEDELERIQGLFKRALSDYYCKCISVFEHKNVS